MNCRKIFEIIDSLNDDYIKIWEDVVKIESPTLYKEGVDKAGNYFKTLAENKNWEIEVSKQSVSGDAICITLNPNAENPPVCISGHLDTVFPVETFKAPIVTKDSEKIYGPGVMDCKGGIVAAFMALDALDKCDFKNRPIKLILQSDEENNSASSNQQTIDFMIEKAKGAEAFLNLEGRNGDTIIVERKGILRYLINVSGIAAHSSVCPKGANAVLEAAHKIIKLEQMKDLDSLTCNTSMIKGGSTPNSVPDSCEFCADIRFKTKEDFEKAKETVEKIVRENEINGCTATCKIISFRPEMEKTDKNIKLAEKINKISEENNLSRLEPVLANGGSDAAYITNKGIPCVDGMGVSGSRIHSIDEYAYIDSLKESAKRIAAFIYSF